MKSETSSVCGWWRPFFVFACCSSLCSPKLLTSYFATVRTLFVSLEGKLARKAEKAEKLMV